MKKLKRRPLAPLILGLLSICMTLVSCRNSGPHWDIPSGELYSLDLALKDGSRYYSAAMQPLDSMKRLLGSRGMKDAERLRLYQKISEFYMARVADSALLYAQRARSLAEHMNNEAEIRRSMIYIMNAYSCAGFFTNATHTLDSISIAGANHEDQILYWQAARSLYSNLANYAGDDTMLFSRWNQKTKAAADTLISLFDKGDPMRIFLEGERAIGQGENAKARAELLHLLASLPKASNLHGMVCFQIARTYQSNDQSQYAAYLAKAAESDVWSGVRDGIALPMLGAWLYEQNEFARAFNYITYSLNEAYAGNARMRVVFISKWVPAIDEAYRHDINRSRYEMMALAILMSLLLGAMVIMMVFLMKEMKKRREAHIALASASRMKDNYIRDFIRLCSAYSEKYDTLSKTVVRKITAGQTQDLIKMVKNGKASESENEDFYRSIDGVFLTIFPDFIEKVNDLLQPDERFEIDKESKNLTPELRIYGFVCLGVTESVKIARILNYSVNTVYTYRNRMRKRAISHESFDEDVMRIGVPDEEEGTA